MDDPLTITARESLGIAAVMARRGVDPAAIGAALGVEMPPGPHVIVVGALAIVGTGPGTWLVLADDPGPDFADDLARTLAGLASVSDQSGGYVVQRFAGAAARTLLQRGVAIDLHPDVFRPGSAAATVIAHIAVVLWQVDDHPTYDIAMARSYAGSFRHWADLTAAAL